MASPLIARRLARALIEVDVGLQRCPERVHPFDGRAGVHGLGARLVALALQVVHRRACGRVGVPGLAKRRGQLLLLARCDHGCVERLCGLHFAPGLLQCRLGGRALEVGLGKQQGAEFAAFPLRQLGDCAQHVDPRQPIVADLDRGGVDLAQALHGEQSEADHDGANQGERQGDLVADRQIVQRGQHAGLALPRRGEGRTGPVGGCYASEGLILSQRAVRTGWRRPFRRRRLTGVGGAAQHPLAATGGAARRPPRGAIDGAALHVHL